MKKTLFLEIFFVFSPTISRNSYIIEFQRPGKLIFRGVRNNDLQRNTVSRGVVHSQSIQESFDLVTQHISGIVEKAAELQPSQIITKPSWLNNSTHRTEFNLLVFLSYIVFMI